MSLKKQLCEVLASIKSDNRMTYDEMTECGLGKTQLVSCIKNSGNEVAIERIESAIEYYGFTISLGVS